jgi:hypothetical protein
MMEMNLVKSLHSSDPDVICLTVNTQFLMSWEKLERRKR